MKYLIQNRKEFAISVAFFIATIINLIRAFMSKEVGQEVVYAFIYAFLGVLAWFYNMPTSEENCRHTGEMRAEKAEKKIGYTKYGEQFYQTGEGEIEDDESDL